MQPLPSFLCDEMLLGLARWLRAAGYDAAAAGRGLRDAELLALAINEGRLLLTRDRGLLHHRGAAGRVMMLEGEGMESWAAELAGRLGVDWQRQPFTRCLVCNHALAPAPPSAAQRVPERSREFGALKWCPNCTRVYWAGGHVRRMASRLARWREAGAAWGGSGSPD